MGKSFKGFSKALSLILAVAMVVTCVPTSAYAAELLADESEDILIGGDSLVEESSDALVNDASASEEKSSSLIDTQKEADLAAAPEENTAGEEDISPDKSLDDTEVWISNVSGSEDDNNVEVSSALKLFESDDSSAEILDNTGAIGIDDADLFDNTTGAPRTEAPDPAEVVDTAFLFADKDNDFSFYLKAGEGHPFGTDLKSVIAKVWYVNYAKAAAADVDDDYIYKAVGDNKGVVVDVTSSITAAKSDFDDNVVLFTIPSSVLKDVHTYTAYKDGEDTKNAQATIVVQIKDNPGASKDVPVTYTVAADKDPDHTLSKKDRTVAYATVTEKNAKVIAGVSATVNRDIAKENIKVTYTPADGDAVTYTTIADPDDIVNAANKATATSKLVAYKDGDVYIAQTLVNDFVLGKADLALEIDTEESTIGKYAVTTVYDNKYAKVASDNEYKKEAPTTIDTTASDFTFYVKATDSLKGTRAVKSVVVKEKNDGTVLKPENDGDKYQIKADPASGYTDLNDIDDDIEIAVITNEQLFAEDTTGAALYNKSNTTLTDVDVVSGEKLKFKVVPDVGKNIKSVKYAIGQNTTSLTDLTGKEDAEGFYETAEVTDGLTIKVETEAQVGVFDVALATSVTGGSVYNGTDLAGSGEALTTAKTPSVVEAGKPYTFTVKRATDKDIASVSVKSGNTLDTATDVSVTKTFDNGVSAVYKTANVNANVFITVEMSDAHKITVPANKKVTVDFADKADAEGQITVPQANDFYFYVTAKADNVVIGDVTTSSTNVVEKTKDDKGNDVYKIPSSALDADRVIKVKTYEIVPFNEGYTTVFAVADEDPKSTTYVPVLQNTYSEDGKELLSQKLNLTLDEKTDANEVNGYVTADFTSTEKGATPGDIGTANKAADKLINPTTGAYTEAALFPESYTAAGKTDIITLSGGTGEVLATGNVVGEDILVAQVLKAEVGNTDNSLVYRAELPVEVTNTYKDVKLVVTRDDYSATNTEEISAIHKAASTFTTDTADSDKVATISAIATNVRTGKTDLLPGSALGAWKFNPYNPDKNPLTATMVASVSGIDLSSNEDIKSTVPTGMGATKIYVATTAAEDLTVEVPIKVNGAKDATTYSASVKAIAEKRYLPYATAEINNGAKEEGLGTGGTYTGYYGLEADKPSSAINGVTLTYDLYEDKTADGSASINNKTELAAALKANAVTKVTPVVTYEFGYYDSSHNKVEADTEYLSVVPDNSGKFTVTAKKALPSEISYAKLTVIASMDGVQVYNEDVAKFEVTDMFEKQEVYLKLDNAKDTAEADKDASYNPTGIKQQKLTASYYTGRTNSIVEKSVVKPGVELADRGIKFTAETKGGIFKLPEQKDFDQSKIGKGFVLVAWQDGKTATTYHYPGEEVTVSDDDDKNTFKAIWSPEYDWADKGTAVTVTGEAGNGLAIYNSNTKTTTDDGDSYAVFTKGTNDTTPSVTAGKLNLGTGSQVSAVLKLNKISPLTEALTGIADEVALLANSKVATPEWVTSGIELASTTTDAEDIIDISGAPVIKPVAGAAGKTANLRATYKYADGNQVLKTIPLEVTIEVNPNYTVTLEDTSLLLNEVQTTGALKTLTATLNKGGSTASAEDIAACKWDWKVTGSSIELVDGATKNEKGINAKALGTSTVTVTVTDPNGVTATLEEAAEVTVNDGGVEIGLLDPEGKPATKILANINGGSSVDTGYTIPAVSGVQLSPSTITAPAGDGTVVTDGNVGTSNKISLDTANAELSDKGTFSVFYKKDTHVFRKVIPVETYYTVTLDAGSSNIILKNGEEYKPSGETVQTATVKVPFSSQKVTENSLGEKVYTYENISLEGYTAKNASDNESFTAWLGASSDEFTTKITKLTGKAAAGNSGTLSAGTFKLLADYETNPVTVSVPDNYVYLVNDNDPKAPKLATKTVSLTVEPAESTVVLWAVPDKINFFKATGAAAQNPVKGNFIIVKGTSDPRVDTLTLTAINGVTLADKRAGAATISIREGNDTAPTSTEVQKLYLYVDGYDSQDKSFYESGEAVKDAVRSIEGSNYYFDTDGKIVEGTKIVTKGDGTKILIIDGKVAPKGKRSAKIDDETNTYYVGDNGEVLTGWITSTGTKAASATDGVYYADPETGAVAFDTLVKDGDKSYLINTSGTKVVGTGTGSIVTYNSKEYFIDKDGVVTVAGLATVDGKQYLFREDGSKVKHGDADVVDGKIAVPAIGGPVYVIEDDDTAKLDKKNVNAKFTWKTKKPSKFEKSSPLPTNEFEITYNVEGDTEKKTVTGTVTAVADPSDYQTIVGLTKLTFTFTPSEADIAGYFSDDKGEKALTVDPEVWTFNFKNGGSTSSSGGIEIVGLEEEYKFAGTAIKPAISVVDNDLGITLAEGTDYKISYKDNTKIGTATITVNGKGNYTGKNVTAQFKIVSATEGIEGLATKVNKVEKIAFNPTYTGEPQAPEKVTVVADGESIVYEWNGSEYQKITDTTKDVGITIVNNVNAGTATVAAVGSDGKAKKANFKINKVDLSAVSAEQLAVEVDEEAEYLVKGAQPGVSVTYTPEGGSAIELINGQDFKVEYKYANKKNAGEGNTIKIKGNGANFTKAKEVTDKPFKIVKHNLQDEDIVSVEAYTGIKPKKVKVVVKDSAGVVVPAKQYEVHVFTDEGLEITADKNAKLEAGKEYTIQVKASASGNLEGEASAKVTAQANIGKAKATLSATLKKDGVAYTGEPIDLENYQSGELIINYFESGIKLTLKGVGDLTYGEDFEVAGYVNNVNKGNMTVYVRGISDKCSGTLGIKIKISAKTMKKAE